MFPKQHFKTSIKPIGLISCQIKFVNRLKEKISCFFRNLAVNTFRAILKFCQRGSLPGRLFQNQHQNYH